MRCYKSLPSCRKSGSSVTAVAAAAAVVMLLSAASPSSALSMTAPPTTTSSGRGENYSEDVYFDQYTAGQRLDQDAYTSSKFWDEVEEHLPKFNKKETDARDRFRAFCDNLRNGEPGKETELPSGQQVLDQYYYPGIDEGDSTSVCGDVRRTAYPAAHYRELSDLRAKLADKVRPVGAAELADLLAEKPLVDDDATADEASSSSDGGGDDEGESWQRAAWYGWQYLNLRGAKRNMPKTATALSKAMGKIGPAHRFVGLSRQRADCEGVVHSDGRNYMLSTLTPIRAPPLGTCGIFVDGTEASIFEDPVILDNTFPHHIYNTHPTEDRFCIMSECYHPALTKKEREAIATLFAVKDRFTVNELQLAPWGYDEDDLLDAMKSGAVNDLDFWRNVAYVPKKRKAKKAGGGGFGK